MTGPPFVEVAPSHTIGHDVLLIVSTEFLGPPDGVLVADGFLASEATIVTLARPVAHTGATPVGTGAAIEKRFETGQTNPGFS